jgi:hypothetical protein
MGLMASTKIGSIYCTYSLIRGGASAIAYHLLRSKAGREGKKERKSELSSSARNDMLGVEIPYIVLHHVFLYGSFS